MADTVPDPLVPNAVVTFYTDDSSPDPSPTWTISIIAIAVLLLIACIPILWCVWARCRLERHNKRRYFKAKASEPSLTYQKWKERRSQAVRARAGMELQQAGGEPHGFPNGGERSPPKREGFGVFGKLFFSKKDAGPKPKLRGVGPVMPGSSNAVDRRDDEEMLVGRERGMSTSMRTPATAMTWGSEAPPAYSSIAAEDHEHERVHDFV